MTENKNFKYSDSKGKEYKVGDVVFNPFFGDFWLVGKYEEPEDECPYYLAQYGDMDLYYMDLDEPCGFEIVCSKDEEDYEKYITELKEIAKRIKEEEAKWEKESQNSQN